MQLGACRQCGCTDDRACAGGCVWVEPDLCSRCYRELGNTGGLLLPDYAGDDEDDLDEGDDDGPF